MRNKTDEVVSRTYYLLFRPQSVKRIIFQYSYVVFLDKDFVVKFFVGSFTVKTTRMFSNYCKSKRNFWGKCAAHQ